MSVVSIKPLKNITLVIFFSFLVFLIVHLVSIPTKLTRSYTFTDNIPIQISNLPHLENQTAMISFSDKKINITDLILQKIRLETESFLSAPITFINPINQNTITVEPTQLLNSLELDFNPATNKSSISIKYSALENFIEQKTIQPKNNDPIIDEHGRLLYAPTSPLYIVNFKQTAQNIKESLQNNDRKVIIAYDIQKNYDKIEQLGITEHVTTFTTYYDCCQTRVDNIKRMADLVDGYILKPNETFNLNLVVSKRTTENGFDKASTIIGNELIDTVGGGVSQFATTIFNTAYWAGLEIITNSPHSWYFPRYPEGIEATISWPKPDLIFKNNTETAILIRATYTDTSISLHILGNNNGRSLVGKQENNKTIINTIDDGGPNARIVKSTVSERFDEVLPHTIYIADWRKPIDGEKGYNGSEGWKVRVERTVIQNNKIIDEYQKTVQYKTKPILLYINPCDPLGTGKFSQIYDEEIAKQNTENDYQIPTLRYITSADLEEFSKKCSKNRDSN